MSPMTSPRASKINISQSIRNGKVPNNSVVLDSVNNREDGSLLNSDSIVNLANANFNINMVDIKAEDNVYHRHQF